jgi:2-polyprenyl-3-methyl-5-hydroxy-6-metoxy-1,4-benzoquinol methylase
MATLSNASRLHCNLCKPGGDYDSSSEKALVRSNVRRFMHEQFEVWRCSSCNSLHSTRVVPLDPYYRHYPLQETADNVYSRILNEKFVALLKRFGLKQEHEILDYGCGSGALSTELTKRGYRTSSYDRYNEKFHRPELLRHSYDFIILQDVIEHVEDPDALMAELAGLLKPNGRLWIGTPNADRLNLEDPESCLGSLHQPYHIHILSAQALQRVAERHGLELERWTDICYADTFFPFLNIRFFKHLGGLFDNTMDALLEPPERDWRLMRPTALFWGFFGGFFRDRTQITSVFVKK